MLRDQLSYSHHFIDLVGVVTTCACMLRLNVAGMRSSASVRLSHIAATEAYRPTVQRQSANKDMEALSTACATSTCSHVL